MTTSSLRPGRLSRVGIASVRELGERAKAASRATARSSTAVKDAMLLAAAEGLSEAAGVILSANAADVEEAGANGASATSLDRLRLTPARLEAMSAGLRSVAALADPVGMVVDGWVRPNGLRVERVRVPLGVIGIIYENRPNVTSDAAGLCVKAGNACLLRGSASALRSNRAIVDVLRSACAATGLDEDSVLLVDDPGREAAVAFMQMDGIVDCLIPRGGRDLIATIREHATVPVVIDGDGNCHVYVDAAADLDMATDIVVNAKVQRPGVCNAAETLLVHRDVADPFLKRAAKALEGVELVGDDRSRAIVPSMSVATDDDYATEFLSLKLAVKVVDGIAEAIDHIARFGSGHSEAIVTRDLMAAERFVREVDAAAVLVNASTRFVDGGELGLGAEIGISTQKLHARGPMGLVELTSPKFVIRGDGQVRA